MFFGQATLTLEILGALFVVQGVGQGIAAESAAPELHRDRTDRVQERAIVGDDQNGTAPTDQVVREPIDGFQVEMVRRLVQEQHLGFAGQHDAER